MKGGIDMAKGTLTSLVPYVTPALVRHEISERIVPPVTDIYETPDAFVVKLDLPGATKESIKMHIEFKTLVVQAEVKNEEEKFLVYSEIGKKRYYREFNLGDGIDTESVTAQFEDGVLTITLPKTEKVKAREIKIQ